MIINKEKMSSKSNVKMRDFYHVKNRISFLLRKTPLIKSDVLSDITESSVYLKPESMQKTGSFKIRGAANKLISLSGDEKRRGVIAFSSGNHGRAVSYVGRLIGVSASLVSQWIAHLPCIIALRQANRWKSKKRTVLQMPF